MSTVYESNVCHSLISIHATLKSGHSIDFYFNFITATKIITPLPQSKFGYATDYRDLN